MTWQLAVRGGRFARLRLFSAASFVMNMLNLGKDMLNLDKDITLCERRHACSILIEFQFRLHLCVFL